MTGKPTREYCPTCGFILLAEPWLGRYRCSNCRDGMRVPVFDPFGPSVSRRRDTSDEEAA